MGEKFVGLVRVSTDEQKDSGLGLLAGRDDLDRYVSHMGGELVEVLEEVESGKHDELIRRPILMKAIRLCKRHNAILLVPKVDRLVRSTDVHTDIKRSGVGFRAVDNPHAGPLTLDILVAVAANEARTISERTRKGLKAYRDHKKVSLFQKTRLILLYCRDIPASDLEDTSTKEGMTRLIAKFGHLIPADALEAVAGKLGSHITGVRLERSHRLMGSAKAGLNRTKKAIESYDYLLLEVRAARASGMTLQAIAEGLNEKGERTRTGALWGRSQVKRLLDRAKGAA